MYLYMIICIIGSGGREHAICKTISLSSKVNKIYCLPGNAGTRQLAENIDLDIDNFEKVLKIDENENTNSEIDNENQNSLEKSILEKIND